MLAWLGNGMVILPAMIRSLGVAAIVTAAIVTTCYFAKADPMIAHVAFVPGPAPRAKIATVVSVHLQGIGQRRDITAATCFCELRIQKLTTSKDAVPAVRSVLAPSSHGSYDELRAVVRFPEPGRYVLQVRGIPKYIGSFEPFSVLVHATVRS